MPEPPDLQALAKRYVELWQDYLTAAAADPDLANNLARLLAAMGTVVALSPWQAWQRSVKTPGADDETGQQRTAPASPGRDRGEHSRPGRAATAARAASAASPPDERDDGLAEFARRLARLDERLAAIEAGPRPADRAGPHAKIRGGRPRARGASRRRRS